MKRWGIKLKNTDILGYEKIRQNKSNIVGRIKLILLLFILIALSLGSSQKLPKLTQAKVNKVLDGNTLEVLLNNKVEKIRFAGIECPEINKPYGKEAFNFVKNQLLDKKIYLEFDTELKDKYKRIQAYVWLEKPKELTEKEIKSKMFNTILLSEGFAQVITTSSNMKYTKFFLNLQKIAKENNKGLWKKEKEVKTSSIIVYITETGKKYHREGCKYLEESKIPISLEEAKRQGYKPCKICKPLE